MVILPDLTATLLASAGIPPPASMVGTPLLPDAVRPALARLGRPTCSSQDAAAQTHRRLLPLFFAGFVISQLLLYAAAALALRLRWSAGRRRRILAATRLTALVAAAVPVSTLPGQRRAVVAPSHPPGWLVAGIAVCDLLVVAAALGGPWRRDILGPGTVIAGVDRRRPRDRPADRQ